MKNGTQSKAARMRELYIIRKCDSIVTGSTVTICERWFREKRLQSPCLQKKQGWCRNREIIVAHLPRFVVEMKSSDAIVNELYCFNSGRVGFEKLTELDYRGTTYYTIRNLSLYECQGWCREEPDCAAASFRFVVVLTFTQMTDKHEKNKTKTRHTITQNKTPPWWGWWLFISYFFSFPPLFSFVVNPLAPIQETVCLLQNETTGASPTVTPQKSVSTYYMIKLNIRSGTYPTRRLLIEFNSTSSSITGSPPTNTTWRPLLTREAKS